MQGKLDSSYNICAFVKLYPDIYSLLLDKNIRTKVLQVVTITNHRLKPVVSKTQ